MYPVKLGLTVGAEGGPCVSQNRLRRRRQILRMSRIFVRPCSIEESWVLFSGVSGERNVANMKVFWFLGSVLCLSGCTWPSDVDRAYDLHLAQDHFKRVPAKDFLLQPWATHIVPNTLQRVLVNGSPMYVFYDILVCHCAFVGDYSSYLQVREFARDETKKLEPELLYVQ